MTKKKINGIGSLFVTLMITAGALGIAIGFQDIDELGGLMLVSGSFLLLMFILMPSLLFKKKSIKYVSEQIKTVHANETKEHFGPYIDKGKV